MTAPGTAADRIAISAPQIGAEVEELVLTVLRSGHLAQGPIVARLEEMGAAMAGTRHAVALSSGTAALEAALSAAGLRAGDEVITSPLTFAATLNAILQLGAVARFADVAPDFTVEPASVESLVNARTRAVLPVHLYGLCAHMPALSALATRHGLIVVEDAAQAHGATVDGLPAGSFGMGCFSFYATKNVAAGEGGMVTTDDEDAADHIRLLRNQGMRERYRYDVVGRNLRMTDLAAAVAVPQMERLAETTRRRQRNAELLSLLLEDVAGLDLPVVPPGRTHVWHQYTVLLPPGSERDTVVRRMGAAGVATGIYYPSLVWQSPAHETHPGVRRDATPRAAAMAQRCLSLPVHPGLRHPTDVERVAAALRAALHDRAAVDAPDDQHRRRPGRPGEGAPPKG